jgi:hypothetical protein
VTDNPFHARTGEDGRFEIQGVPPGTWTLRVWHERLGEHTFRIEMPREGGVDAGLFELR